MGKGETARNEQFLVFPQCFQKACFPGASKGVVVWEWVKAIIKIMCLDMRQHGILNSSSYMWVTV